MIQDDTRFQQKLPGSSSNRTTEQQNIYQKAVISANDARPISTGRRLRKPRYVLPLARSIVQVTFDFQPLTRRPLLPLVTMFELRIGWLCLGWASLATIMKKVKTNWEYQVMMVHDTKIDRANSTNKTRCSCKM